jgi:hypothetical protein
MSSFADAGEKRPFSVHDMLAMDRISDVRPSPDGSQLLFSLRKTDVAGNRGATSVWMVGLDGKPPRMALMFVYPPLCFRTALRKFPASSQRIRR